MERGARTAVKGIRVSLLLKLQMFFSDYLFKIHLIRKKYVVGGPLVTKSKVNGKPTLIGVVSFGIGCATRLFPGVYSRVSAAREWISLQTAIQMVDI